MSGESQSRALHRATIYAIPRSFQRTLTVPKPITTLKKKKKQSANNNQNFLKDSVVVFRMRVNNVLNDRKARTHDYYVTMLASRGASCIDSRYECNME